MKVTFSCLKKHLGAIPYPVPAVKAAPDYFKSVKPQENLNPGSSTVKRCVPFLDALSAGFIIPMWSDVWVFAKNGELQIDFPIITNLDQTLEKHNPNQIPNHPLSKNPYGNMPLKWMNPWILQTDPGVSCLFTSPLNHLETRFKLLDGVVDTDTYYNNVHFPFIWTGGDGEFLIKRGTPLVQVIPFRRESANLEISEIDADLNQKVHSTMGSKIHGGYKEFYSARFSNKNQKNSENIYNEAQDIQSATSEQVNTSAEAEDPLKFSESKSQSTSGILEVVADDKGRGFGEGEF